MFFPRAPNTPRFFLQTGTNTGNFLFFFPSRFRHETKKKTPAELRNPRRLGPPSLGGVRAMESLERRRERLEGLARLFTRGVMANHLHHKRLLDFHFWKWRSLNNRLTDSQMGEAEWQFFPSLPPPLPSPATTAVFCSHDGP